MFSKEVMFWRNSKYLHVYSDGGMLYRTGLSFIALLFNIPGS